MSKPFKPVIDSVRYTEMSSLPGWERLINHDIRLTWGDGMSLYSKGETLAEIEKHHDPEWSIQDDFNEMKEIIIGLPEDVMLSW